MKVVITGANSAVGRAILRYASKEQSPAVFIAAVRSSQAEQQIRSACGEIGSVSRVSFSDLATLDAAFCGASAVIHLAGILVEQRHSTYEQANIESTRAVVEAAKRNRVEKIILVSAIGADENSSNRYFRTKGAAEALVRGSGLKYTILRVPILMGPGTAGAATLRRHLSGERARLIDGGRYRQQPLHVDDLARAAVIAATQLPAAQNATLEMVGPCSLAEREMIERAAQLVGRAIRIKSVPKSILSFALAIRQRVSGPGFSPDVLDVITQESRADPQLAAREFGIELTGIDQMIRDSLTQGPANE
jgi:uncharacterized protein YbjT (DUF2867 family)